MPTRRARGRGAGGLWTHRVHLGGGQDVVLAGLRGLGLGAAAAGAASHTVQLPILRGSVDLSHLGWGGRGERPGWYPLAPGFP